MGDWHKANVSDVALEFGTDIKSGRTNIDSARVRKHNNSIFKLPSADAKSIVRHMSSDASLILLAVTYLLASFLGYVHESLLGIIMIAIFFIIGCSIKYRSEMRVTNSYMMLLPIAKVTENGQRYRLSTLDVEVGDLIDFVQGDIIPADARLVFSSNLSVAERFLDENTGRSIYKRFEKKFDIVVDEADPSEHYDNMVYAGSMVVSGKGSAIVTAIGSDTLISRLHSGISFTPQNDKPTFLSDFNKSAKRFSLTALFCVVPVALTGLLAQTLNSKNTDDYDLLYLFLLSVSLASTCMSELVSAPAESLLTKEILPSSRQKKNERIRQSRITRLSSAEPLADADTLLILSPEILVDKNHLVRRVLFADKEYRFDALASGELKDFASQIHPYFSHMPSKLINSQSRLVSEYIKSLGVSDKCVRNLSPKFVRNYPMEGARSCVLEFDSNGVPARYISQSNDIIMLRKCAYFRTEGGGLWKIDNRIINRISEYFDSCVREGLDAYIYISRESSSEKPVFEGIVAVGVEYPYADGYLADDFFDSGIHPILVLENESDANIEFALKCGLVTSRDEIAVGSEFSQAGLEITDASISAKVYIGFGKSGTEKLVQRLYTNGKNVLPIIKDSTNRRALAPNSVYATHQLESFDSVRIASSLNIMPADTQTRSGGLADVVKAVRGSAMARLKLGVYKNYLIFSAFTRITSVVLPLLFGKNELLMTALMVLLSGFSCDYIALLIVMHSKQIAVSPKNILFESKRLLSPSLAIFSAVTSFIASLITVAICSLLVSANQLPISTAPTYIMYSCVAVQILSLGAFLVVLKKNTRSAGGNMLYCSLLLMTLLMLFIQSILPKQSFDFLGRFGIGQIPTTVLIYIALPALFAFISVVFVIGKMATFAASK